MMAETDKPPDPKTCKHRFVEKEYYECEYCNKAFTTAYNLSRHKKGNCQENVCQKCNLRFQKLEQLKEHMVVCTGKQPYQCEFCGKSFLKNSNLLRHRQTHTERCELCGALFYKRLPLIEMFPEQVLHKCKHCDEGFKTKELLDVHFQKHYESNVHQCEECYLSFNKRRQLLRHQQKEHAEMIKAKKARKTYACPVCQRVFLKKKDRKKHLQIHIEAGIKIHSCKVCGKSYSQEKTLRMHMIKHGSDDKKPRCKICNKMFSHPFSLRYHMRIHNNVKPCVCKVCGAAFRQAGHLTRHLLTHSAVPKEKRERTHTCKICNKSYTSDQDLKHHMFIHNGEKKFSCQYCGKSFLFKRTLDHHVNTHTGHKPYKCHLCDKAFAQPGSLHKHRQTHYEVKNNNQDGDGIQNGGIQNGVASTSGGGHIQGSRALKVIQGQVAQNIARSQQHNQQLQQTAISIKPTKTADHPPPPHVFNSVLVENVGGVLTSNGLLPARSMHQAVQIPQQLVLNPNQLQPIHHSPPSPPPPPHPGSATVTSDPNIVHIPISAAAMSAQIQQPPPPSSSSHVATTLTQPPLGARPSIVEYRTGSDCLEQIALQQVHLQFQTAPHGATTTPSSSYKTTQLQGPPKASMAPGTEALGSGVPPPLPGPTAVAAAGLSYWHQPMQQPNLMCHYAPPTLQPVPNQGQITTNTEGAPTTPMFLGGLLQAVAGGGLNNQQLQ